ncbi:MAG: ATP-binding protein, partial [Bacteroidota bacterium]|nr:ATP-binding protein [Bacteroidota bacterium]
MMDRQVEHMVHLIDDLLDVSRISRGTIELRKQRIELRSVIEQAVEISRPLIQKAGHKLNVLLQPDRIMVDVDVTRLTQVFNNLLNNASKYTEPGGNISISMRLEAGEAIVTVSDDGLGIPEKLLNEVFEMFAQVDRSLERSQAGLGIGLSIVKRLVVMHGGRVEAHSEGLGRGSRFMVFLPVDGTEAPAAVHAISAPGAKNRKSAGVYHRILVVDDNMDATATMANIFKVLGHQVRTAKNGFEAVEIAGEFHPEIVFMDIGMPGMNGYEACRQIRDQKWSADALMVALTGWGQEEDRKRSEEAGFDHHMVKPASITIW